MERISISNKIIEVDRGCFKMVLFFNELGLKTKYCCEGHNSSENYYIMLDETVKDSEIENFIARVSEGYVNTPLGLGFKKWIRKVHGETRSNWIYNAKDKQKAEVELKLMKEAYEI